MTSRKRAATFAHLQGQEENKKSYSKHSRHGSEDLGSSENSGNPPAHICLCQPDPKIPRPRNAFILYRQRYQAEILAQHPGLPNPEISKIAGELWKAEPESVKNEWKLLAEEEKARHAQLYPDYRFRPKHKSRQGSGSITGLGPPLRCPKCGGRTIGGGGSPLSSPLGTARYPPSSATSPTPNSESGNNSGLEGRYISQISNLSLSSPEAQGFQLSSGSPVHNRFQNGERMSDAKRRRFSPYPIGFGPGGRENICDEDRPSTSGIDHRRSHSQESTDPRRQSLPYPHQAGHQVIQPLRTSMALCSPRAATTAGNVGRTASFMGPPSSARPPQPHSIQPPTPTSARLPLTPYGLPIGQGRSLTRPDEALRLPPLQTSPMTDSSKGIGLQVMNLNVIAKIKLLRAVAAPLSHARPDSIGTGLVRGAVIAMEGEDWLAVNTMKQGLQELLSRDFDIQIIPGPPEPREPNVGFASYMQMISEWHNKRSEILKFLTGADQKPLSPFHIPLEHRLHAGSHEAKDVDNEDERHTIASDSAESTPSNKPGSRFSSMSSQRSKRNNSRAQDQKNGIDSLDAEVSPKGTSVQPNSEQSGPPTTSASGASNSITDVGSSSKIPLLLIPHYILHAANAWASALPINDTYSLADHWQWVATLWRGVIGPDFTVYVHNAEEPDTALPPSVAGARPAVDIREELGALIVRSSLHGENEGGSGLRVEEGSIRRVAFEVGEWARVGR